jgi:hypothetical protein
MENLKLSPELRALVDRIHSFAAHRIAEGEELMPLWHAIPSNPESPHLIVGTPWGSDEEKAQCFAKVQEVFREHDVVRYAMALEAWIKTDATQDDFEKASQVGVKNLKDRGECVVILAVERGAIPVYIFFPIHRPNDGPPQLMPPLLYNPVTEIAAASFVDIEPAATRH